MHSEQLRRPAPDWHRARGVSAVLDSWIGGKVGRDVVADHEAPGRDAVWAELPSTLAAPVRAALERRGVHRLFSHQARAFELASAGRDVVVATPTASGKSLCYNLPVLDRLARDPSARALYLFPTKALSRDQEGALRVMMGESGLDTGAITYDGDTPGDARRAARERSGILITNPDMLHAGILPHHAAWARFFARLAYVVVDELHMYRGVFGSHLANVLRRLARIAAFHGSEVRFLFASATIANPAEHAGRLIGREVALVDESGAPTGPRRFLFYNPPVVNQELGVRASYTKSAVRLATDLLRAEVPTLIFGQSRNQVEVMLKYLRDFHDRHHVPEDAIQAYRGGYLPETRRRIEEGLRDGSVRCVVATNALELGIDIGQLDAVICAGYPGSVAGLWQRFGRAGRRQEQSLAVLVASSAPLDQYLARAPDSLVGAPVESARVDPDNVEILVQHLKCAAFELPFERGERFGDVPPEAVEDALGYLADHRVVQPVTGRSGATVYHWSTDAYPANAVSLRSASWDNYVIVDVERTQTIAEMDWRSTHTMLHEQAIYQHEGEQYQVERLDYANHKAFVRKVAPDYYTTAMTHTKVRVLYEDDAAAVELGGGHGLRAAWGEVNVVSKVVGYKKIKFHTHENVGYGDVNLPEIQLPTSACWLAVPNALVERRPEPRPVVIDALRGLGHAMHTVACLGLMIDPRDLGHVLVDGTDDDAPPEARLDFDPTLYLYDSVAGGIGLAARLFIEREEVLRRARHMIETCGCADGCPACVGPVMPLGGPGGALPSRRGVALELLSALGLGTH